jgi:hypothetical protein
MSRLRDAILITVLGLQIAWGWLLMQRLYPGEHAYVVNEIGKPYAVLTIDYGEPPKRFVEGEFYVLKVLKIRGTKIDYGFCPIRRDGYYDKE